MYVCVWGGGGEAQRQASQALNVLLWQVHVYVVLLYLELFLQCT